MKPKHLITLTALLTAALILFAACAPVAADETLEYHPLGFSLADIRETVAEIIADNSYTSAEKLDLQAAAFGMDERLNAWLLTPRDSETGEIEYETYIPVVTPILQWLGLTENTNANPYSEEEGAAAWNEYHATALAEYKPTGGFPGA